MKGERYSVDELLANESLQRWVLGVASAEEKRYWSTFSQVYPQHADAMDEAVEILSVLGKDEVELPSEGEISQEWEAVLRRVGQPTAEEAKPSLRLVPRFNMYRIAAAIAFLLLAGSITWGYTQGHVVSLFQHTYSTEYGERAVVQLADGSSVVLNAHSTLRSPRRFAQHKPFIVHLEGEAFFDVTKRTKEAPHHFSVRTPHGDVSVLGTRFNVNNRGEQTRVTLNEGGVRVTHEESDQNATLSPGQSALLEEAAQTIEVQEVNPVLHSSWTTSHLRFDQTPLSEIISLLKYTYGYNVIVEDEALYDFNISGQVENEQQVVLKGLATLMDRSIIFENGVVIIQ